MSMEFDKVILKIGYTRFYTPPEFAMQILTLFSGADVLLWDTDYRDGRSLDVAKPLPDEYVEIQSANVAKAFARIAAYDNLPEDRK